MSADSAGFGIYVHWPYCLAKCPYCDFNSHVRPQGVDEERYVRALVRELGTIAGRIGPRTVDSVFFGGGTPSLMQPASVASVLRAVAQRFAMAANIEITLEANPTSVEAARFRGYRDAGVNRLSLGIQSLHEADLAALGRRHTVDEALAALDLAQRTFRRVSIDLIYARPGQKPADWRYELARALSLGTEHLSLYQLTIEEGTPFFGLRAAGKLVVPDDDVARALFDVTQEVTAAAGLPAYEVSNHAKPGAECRHNLVYWRSGEFAGIGPGAHGRLNIEGSRRALANEKSPAAWLASVEKAGAALITDEALTRREIGDEFLLMGLRLAEGIDLARYTALAGYTIDRERLVDLAEHGLIEEIGANQVRVTPAGFPVLDAVVADLAA